MSNRICPHCGSSYKINSNKCPYCRFDYNKMKVNPNPMCKSCTNQNLYFIDAGCGPNSFGIEYNGPVGMHYMCKTPEESFSLEGYTPMSRYYDEYIIDGFEKMHGECKFYKKNINFEEN